jgi:hypothetical protein
LFIQMLSYTYMKRLFETEEEYPTL